MQTFLPYADFDKTAMCLDRMRLGKQRVECLQILNAITDPSYGWQNHPAVKMWRGYEESLFQYMTAICNEWTKRGYKDTCLLKFTQVFVEIVECTPVKPSWLGREDFHRSHRSNLLRKNPGFYAEVFEQGLPDDLPYVWPVD